MTIAPPRSVARTYRGRLIVLGAIALTALNLRTAVTGFSAIATTVEDALGFGPAVTGLVGTLITACFALCAFLAPAVARRLGLERAAMFAVILTTVGLVLRATAGSTAMLLVSTVVAFAGVGASNVLVIPVVKRHFDDRIKTISTAYMVLLQIGQFVAPIVAVAVTAQSDWRVSMGIWPVLTAVAAVLWVVVVVRTPPASASVAPVVAPSSLVHRRSPLLWGLIGLMGMTTLHTYALVTWLPSMFGEAGLGDLASASLLSTFAVVGLAAAIVVPALVGRLANPYGIVVACVLFLLAGYLGMVAAPASAPVLWAVLLGLGVSTFPLCLTLIGTRTSSPAEAASLSGIVQGVGYSIGCLGPVLLGLLNEQTGSWTPSYAFLIATLVITLGAGWFACRPSAVRL